MIGVVLDDLQKVMLECVALNSNPVRKNCGGEKMVE